MVGGDWGDRGMPPPARIRGRGPAGSGWIPAPIVGGMTHAVHHDPRGPRPGPIGDGAVAMPLVDETDPAEVTRDARMDLRWPGARPSP